MKRRYPPRKPERMKIPKSIGEVSYGCKLPPLPDGVSYDDLHIEYYSDNYDNSGNYGCEINIFYYVDESDEDLEKRMTVWRTGMAEYKAWYKANEARLKAEDAAKEEKRQKNAVKAAALKKKQMERELKNTRERLKQLEEALSKKSNDT